MATSNPPQLAEFEGQWTLTRRIIDFAGGPDGALNGVATFIPDGIGLAYRECGTLRLQGCAPIRAERAYLWRRGAVGTIDVFFADGRPFHAFIVSSCPDAVHLCGHDTYRVAYDFDSWPAWQSVWRVTGPRKDYEMTTIYTPLALGQGMGDTGVKRDFTDGRGA